jgi:cytochrome c biogenesis protein CcdA
LAATWAKSLCAQTGISEQVLKPSATKKYLSGFMLHILQIWFVNFLQLAVLNSMKRCKSHHKRFQERIVGYLVSPAAWPSVLGWHTFGTIISIQNETKHDPDLLKHAPNPLEARLCPAEIVGPCASTPVDMHKIDEE